MNYRKITIEDIPTLSKIYAETFNSAPWYDKWTEKTAGRRLSQMVNNGVFFGILSYDEEGINGMILGEEEQYFDGVVFNIKEFCVKNNLRGKGIGTALLKEFENELKQKGIREAVLMTNTEDCDFYKNKGYKQSPGIISMNKEL